MTYVVDDRAQKNFWAKVDKGSSCWIWTGALARGGYGAFSVRRRPYQYHYKAHRYSWYLEYGDPYELMVCHLCDTPLCVYPSHLFLGTNAENLADMSKKGRAARGERSANAKLTESQALEVLVTSGTHQSIADRYGVSRVIVTQIKNGTRWSHLSATMKET